MQGIDGIIDIETNVGERTCSFKVTKPDLDYQSQLSELAKTNSHLAEFEIL